MVKVIIDNADFNVSIEAYDDNADIRVSYARDDLTFMQASDYVEHASNYFRYAILEHPEWSSVQIEVGNAFGPIEAIEITRDA